MTSYQSQAIKPFDYPLMLKSFLLWTGVLTICLLIAGFPVGILIVTVGSMLAMMLHSLIPGVGIILVVSGVIGVQLVGVMIAAATLALNGTHPKDISWLPWLSGTDDPQNYAVFASCPLTCELK